MRKPVKLKRAKVVRVRPGDVIMVTVPPEDFDRDSLERICDEVQKLFPNNPVGVIVGGSVTVFRGVS